MSSPKTRIALTPHVLFLSHDTSVYAIGAGVQVIISLPAGILYDVAGPSMISVLGGLLSALGLTSMGLSISYPSYNWWLYWAYPLTIGG